MSYTVKDLLESTETKFEDLHPEVQKFLKNSTHIHIRNMKAAIDPNSEYSFGLRLNAAKNPKATKDHLDKALNDENHYVREAAARNPNASKEHLDKALNDKSEIVRKAAVR